MKAENIAQGLEAAVEAARTLWREADAKHAQAVEIHREALSDVERIHILMQEARARISDRHAAHSRTLLASFGLSKLSGEKEQGDARAKAELQEARDALSALEGVEPRSVEIEQRARRNVEQLAKLKEQGAKTILEARAALADHVEQQAFEVYKRVRWDWHAAHAAAGSASHMVGGHDFMPRMYPASHMHQQAITDPMVQALTQAALRGE